MAQLSFYILICLCQTCWLASTVYIYEEPREHSLLFIIWTGTWVRWSLWCVNVCYMLKNVWYSYRCCVRTAAVCSVVHLSSWSKKANNSEFLITNIFTLTKTLVLDVGVEIAVAWSLAWMWRTTWKMTWIDRRRTALKILKTYKHCQMISWKKSEYGQFFISRSE